MVVMLPTYWQPKNQLSSSKEPKKFFVSSYNLLDELT
jgi:hypothetical protein